MVEVRQRDNMVVEFDDTHRPLILSTFRGAMELEDAIWHDEVSSRVILQAQALGQRVLHVVDARDVSVPSAQLRKFWATRLTQSVTTLEAMLGVLVVIDKPILRGVLTAINWLSQEARRVEYFPTLSDALNLANLRFAAAGYASVPVDIGAYRGPSHSSPPRHSYQAPIVERAANVLPEAARAKR